MIDHTGVPVTNLARSIAFYQAALAPLGYALIAQFPPNAPMAAGFGVGGKPDFWIHIGPVHEGIHTAFRADKRSIVNAFYQAALASGGRDNGAPGTRSHYHQHYYGGFVLDPDGHNIETVCHEAYLG
jgi:catechol 2,3-dioxygenase-like lactoylglutathione lyase family enzyme